MTTSDSASATPAFIDDQDVIDDTFSATPLFEGDTGQLPEQVRLLYVQVLKSRYISADRHPNSWALLLKQEPALRTRLNDQFLDLVIDHEHQVAYKVQTSPGGDVKHPSVLRDQSYTREETILLYTLRRLLTADAGAAVFMDRSELIEAVEAYRPADSTDKSSDLRSARNAVDKLESMHLLSKTDTPHRYRAAPIIRALMSVQQLRELESWLRTATDPSTPDDGIPTPPDASAQDEAAYTLFPEQGSARLPAAPTLEESPS